MSQSKGSTVAPVYIPPLKEWPLPKREDRSGYLPSDIRVVVMGCGGVGKSTFCAAYISGIFIHEYDPCIDSDTRKHVLIDNHTTVVVDMLDTAGGEEFSSMIPQWVREASVVLLCYDIVNRQSFATLKEFYYNKFIRPFRVMGPNVHYDDDVPCVLVGMKADLDGDPHLIDEAVRSFKRLFGWGGSKSLNDMYPSELITALTPHALSGINDLITIITDYLRYPSSFIPPPEREVSQEMARAMADEMTRDSPFEGDRKSFVPFIECSSKTGKNVTEVMDLAIRMALRYSPRHRYNVSIPPYVTAKPLEKQDSGCSIQ